MLEDGLPRAAPSQLHGYSNDLLTFRLPQPPPGQVGLVVVLVVVAEEVATHEGPEVVAELAARLVGVIGGVLTAVRQVGTEEEELQRGQDGGYHPEGNDVG